MRLLVRHKESFESLDIRETTSTEEKADPGCMPAEMTMTVHLNSKPRMRTRCNNLHREE